jgi:hypothetical protein
MKLTPKEKQRRALQARKNFAPYWGTKYNKQGQPYLPRNRRPPGPGNMTTQVLPGPKPPSAIMGSGIEYDDVILPHRRIDPGAYLSPVFLPSRGPAGVGAFNWQALMFPP